MSTLKDKTITSTYDQIVKRQDAYAGYNRIELMNDSGVSVNTPLYLGTDDIGIGVSNPAGVLDVLIGDNKTAIFRAADSGIAALIGTETDGAGYFATCDEGGIPKAKIAGKDNAVSYLNNGGNFGIGTATPAELLDVQNTSGHSRIRVLAGTNSSAQLLLQNDAQIWNINCQVGDNFAIYDDTDDTERLVIDTDGKVGIGTTTPQVELEISSVDPQLRLSDSNSTSRTNAIAYMEMYDRSTSRLGYVGFGANSNEILYILNEGTTTGVNGGDIYFCTQNQSSNPKMMIDVEGNVGIGTSAPDTLLEVRGGTGTGFTGAGHLRLSTAELSIQNSSSDVMGLISFCAPLEGSGTDAILPGAAIWAQAEAANFLSNANNTALVFATANSETAVATGQERMRIDSSGKVGIGTAAPAGTLQVGADSTDSSLYISNYGSISYTGSTGTIGIDTKKNMAFTIDSDNNDSTEYFSFNNASTEHVRIKADGNVGIGTTNPSKKLHIKGIDDSTCTVRIESFDNDTAANCPIVQLYRAKGTGASPSIVADDDNLGKIEFGGWIGDQGDDGNYEDGALILARVDGAPSNANNDLPTELVFFTNANGSTDLTQRMCIDSNGFVGIGNANPNQDLHVGDNVSGDNIYVNISSNTDSAAGVLFSVNNGAKWRLENNTADDLQVYDYSDTSTASHISPGDNDWQTGSDERIKKDIVNIGSILDSINKLRPVTWKRKYGKIDRNYPGLIAQEVLPEFPLVVSGDVDTFKEVTDENGNLTCEGGLSIGYNGLVPYLIKAIQELSAKVTALENA